jgi:hypothetical protein
MVSEPLAFREPFQPPDATQLSAYVELQLRIVDSPSLILEADTDKAATGTAACNGDIGSGVTPCTTPESAPAVWSVKFSSVPHAVSRTEMIKRAKLLDNTGQNNFEIVINALRLDQP